MPLTLGAGGQIAIGFLFPRFSRPERWILAGDCLSVLTIGWGVAMTGGLQSPLVPLFALPLVAVAGRHTLAVVGGFTALCLAAPLVAALFAVNHGMSYGDARIAADFAAIGGVAAILVSLMRAERQYRHQSLLDPLTGLLNRFALDRRFEELSSQAARSGGVLCVIAADLDELKLINDEHGHDVGDAVLCDVAEALRTTLRTFSLLYRIGGEEFVAVLPGLDAGAGALAAERMRAAVEQCRSDGVRITMSFGVAAAVGGDVDHRRLLGAADACLYTAKRSGRNRVVCTEASPVQLREPVAARRGHGDRRPPPAHRRAAGQSPGARAHAQALDRRAPRVGPPSSPPPKRPEHAARR